MADKKITELNELTSLTSDDLFVVVNSPASSAETMKITKANALSGYFDKTSDDTDDITEGTKKFYSSSLFDSDFSGKTTDDLSEGTANKYYSTSLFNTDFAAKDTDDLSEGTTNRYYSSSLFNNDWNTKKLSDISDVDTTGIANNYILKWDSTNSKWIVSAESASGEANTASNQGVGGVGVFYQKSGVDLQFKNINAGSNKVSVNDDTSNHEIDIDIVPSNINTSDLNNDAGFITSSSSDTLTNKSGNISMWTNDSGYLTDITGESINDLSDVDASSATDGQTLTYNATTSKWEAQTPSGTGDMLKSTYDTDDDGVVDDSEKLNGQLPSYYLSRANHTGTQPASTISDFDTEVSNNSDVSANTIHRGTTSGNPHSVTASDVGNTTAQWNANKIQGTDVDTTGLSDGYILKYNGTSLKWVVAAESGGSSPLTTKGDIYTHDGSSDARLPVGTDGQILSVDSSTSTGLKWINNSGGSGSPGGSDTQMQYNDGGSFGGANVYYDDTKEYTGFRQSSPTAVIDAKSVKGTISSITYSGSGLNDMTTSGNYCGIESHTYKVEIWTTGTPDRIRVQKDGVAFGGSVLSLTTDLIEIEEGIFIQFSNTTGHASDDEWTFTTTGADPVKQIKDYDGNTTTKVDGYGQIYLPRWQKPSSSAKGLRLVGTDNSWGVPGVLQGTSGEDYSIVPARISTTYSNLGDIDIGANAVDLAPSKQYITDTAKGDYSGVLAGYRNRVDTDGTRSVVVGGNLSQVSAEDSFVGGGRACKIYSGYTRGGIIGSRDVTIKADNSVILASRNGETDYAHSSIISGRYVKTRWSGEIASGISYLDASLGEAQSSFLTISIQTTDATETELKIQPNGYNEQIVLDDNMTIGYTIRILARQTDGTSGTIGDSHRWVYNGIIKRGSGASTTALIDNTQEYSNGDSATSGWSVSITADTTNGALKITGTGEANKTIKWLASLRMEILQD